MPECQNCEYTCLSESLIKTPTPSKGFGGTPRYGSIVNKRGVGGILKNYFQNGMLFDSTLESYVCFLETRSSTHSSMLEDKLDTAAKVLL